MNSKKLLRRPTLTLCLISIGLSAFFLFYYSFALFFVIRHDPQILNKTLQAATQRHFAGNVTLGEVHWQIFPTIALKIDAIEIQLPTQKKLLRATKSTFYPQFWSMLFGQIRVKTLNIKHLETTIDFTNTKSEQRPSLLKKNKKETMSHFDTLKDLNVKKIRVDQLKAHIITPTTHAMLHTSHMNINHFQFEEPSNIELSAQLLLEYKGASLSSKNVDINSTFILTKEKLNFISFQSSSDWKNIMSVPDVAVDLRGSATFEFKKKSLVVEPFTLTINNHQLMARASIKQRNKKNEYIFTIPVQKPYLGTTIRQLYGEKPPMDYISNLIDTVEIGGHFVMTGSKKGLLLNVFNINAHPGSINISHNADTNQWQSEIDLSYIDLRPILEPRKKNQIIVRDIALKLDPKAQLEPKAHSDPRMYLNAIKNAVLPVKLLRSLQLHSSIKVGTLFHPRFKATNLNVLSNVNKGIMNFKLLKGHFFKGKTTLNSTLNVNLAPPQLKLTHKSFRLDVQDILKHHTTKQWFKSHFDSTMNITSQGNSIGQLIDNSVGTLDIKMATGYFPGFNLQQIVYNSTGLFQKYLNKESLSSFKESLAMQTPGTQIQDFFAAFKISQKNISSSQALVQINNEPKIGNILYDRSSHTMYFTYNFQLPSSKARLSRLTWPVSCLIKNWEQPICGVNQQEMLKNINALP